VAASKGGIVTKLTGENARVWSIQGSQTEPGSRFGMQVIWHNAAWVSTEATADTAFGPYGSASSLNQFQFFMASFFETMIESHACRRIPGTVRPRVPVLEADIVSISGINALADCP